MKKLCNDIETEEKNKSHDSDATSEEDPNANYDKDSADEAILV